MTTQDDLNWWLELAPTLEWTFAELRPKRRHTATWCSTAPSA